MSLVFLMSSPVGLKIHVKFFMQTMKGKTSTVVRGANLSGKDPGLTQRLLLALWTNEILVCALDPHYLQNKPGYSFTPLDLVIGYILV